MQITYDWAGIPGIVCAAPTIQVYDMAQVEQLIEEEDHVHVDRTRYQGQTLYGFWGVRSRMERDRNWLMIW